MYTFECRLAPILPGYPNIRINDPDMMAHLLIVPDWEKGTTMGSAIVTTGSHGGFVPSGFALFEEPDIQRGKWLVNPFAVYEGEGERERAVLVSLLLRHGQHLDAFERARIWMTMPFSLEFKAFLVNAFKDAGRSKLADLLLREEAISDDDS